MWRHHAHVYCLFLSVGNEFGNLDVWKANDYTYSPCMVNSPNVLCVGGTMPDNSVLFVMNGNSRGGSNYGTSTVNMGAPSIDMLTTVIGSGHDRVAGTSYATPLTAAVAGLVQGVVGLTSEGNGSAAAVKNILMGSGDYFASLPFRTQRKLNASRAIASAIAFVSNGTLCEL